jgi:hypothetical protein
MMKTKRRLGLFLVLISGGLSVLWGCSLGWSIQGGPLDFQAVYYGARTLIHHQNPYNVSDLETVFQSDGRDHSSLTPKQHHLITLFVNTPATLFFVAPFALLPLVAGQALWMCFTAGSLILAGYLMWTIGAEHAPILTGCLIGFLLLNCQVVFAAGNTAAIVVGLCVVAIWCFVKERFIPAGVVCMAISLAIKPHDAGVPQTRAPNGDTRRIVDGAGRFMGFSRGAELDARLAVQHGNNLRTGGPQRSAPGNCQRGLSGKHHQPSGCVQHLQR